MSRRDCQRADLWMAAVEAGELDPASRIRLLDHLETCPSCAARAAGISRLVGLLRDEPTELSADRLELIVERVRAGSTASSRRQAPAARTRWLLVASAALLLVVAGGLFLWRALPPPPGRSGRAAAPELGCSAPRWLLVGQGALGPGARLVVGASECAVLTSTAEVLVASAGARLFFASEGCVPVVRLEEGKIALGTRGRGTKAVVLVGVARVRPVGTIYSVSGSGRGRPEVAVARGRVEVSSGSGSLLVDTGQELVLGEQPRALAALARRELEREILDAEEIVAGRARPASRPASRPAAEEAAAPALDLDHEIRAIEGLLARGATRPARARARQLLGVPAARPRSPALETLVAESFLREGRYSQARDAYLRIWAHHPLSAYGGDALYMAGSLELDQLARPDAARRYFTRYLATYSRGRQREGAHYLLCRSLLRLGQTAAAQAAAARYLAEFPRGQFRQELGRLGNTPAGSTR